ncbi:MAG TPA: hypothetical protein VD913_06710, partial [bacterium]|nr:hypothetical protein [bacterium]
LWFSGIVFSLSLVARLHFILIAPVFLVMAFSDKERLKGLFLFILGALIPLGAWYGWTYYLQTKEPLHVMTSLFMQAGDGRILMTDLFKNVDYYKRIIEILAELWLTPVLFGFIVLGLLRWDRERLPFIFWLFGSLLTFILLSQKAFDHPFYLISGLPAASILAAAVLSEISNRFSLGAKISFFAIFLVFSMRYFVPPAFSGGAENQKIPAMGNYLESMTGPHDLLIAQYGSAPDLLYYAGRKGWPFDLGMKENMFRDPPKIPGFTAAEGYGDPVQWLEKLRSFGARYLVISQPDKLEGQKDFSDYISGAYEVVPVPGNSFLIFDLQKARS